MTNFYLKYHDQVAHIQSKQKIQPEAYLAFKKDGFILNFIDSLLLLAQQRQEISTGMKLLKFEELLLHLLEQYPVKLLAFQPGTIAELTDFEIRKAVQSNIATNITIEELAFLCNASLSTFKRRFAKIFNTSPSKWILQQRMEMAKELLRHHGEKPAEIFYKLGYENHSSFSKSFKQTFGITPQDFQKQQLNVLQ